MRLDPASLVIWQDEHLLAIHKPPGLLSLPDGHDSSKAHVCALMEPHFGRLWIVHRLDRDTSGLLLLARHAGAHRHLNAQFEQRAVDKVYHALVASAPDWEQVSVDLPLRVNAGRRKRTVVDETRGAPAHTGFRLLERFEGYALVEARPKTGRRHQIRAHLWSLGCSLVGDPLYGPVGPLVPSQLNPAFRPGVKGECAILARQGLHAWSLRIRHPAHGNLLDLQAPYPPDFNGALRMLRKYARP